MTKAIEARPALYRGIRMRSRLEADYAAYLDRENISWEYEPECFASPEGQWLPDFRVEGPRIEVMEDCFESRPSLVELKPVALLASYYVDDSIDKILSRMTIAWASKPDAVLMLVCWKYGGPAALVITADGCHPTASPDIRGPRSPWVASASGPLPLLWTGMGQYARCET